MVYPIQILRLLALIQEALQAFQFEILTFELLPPCGALFLKGGVNLDIRHSSRNLQGKMFVLWQESLKSWVFNAEISGHSANETGSENALSIAVKRALGSVLDPISIKP